MIKSLERVIQPIYLLFLSDRTRKLAEFIIVMVAIGTFVLHLGLIAANEYGWVDIQITSNLFTNPISAIYTPFSFILIYEVYLLIYYLPKSISRYIGKQYEIITLILIRRIYYDLANLEFTESWFRVKSDLQFTYDIVGTILLFGLIFFFYRLNQPARLSDQVVGSEELQTFIRLKKIIATALVPILISLAVYNLGGWISRIVFTGDWTAFSLKEINSIFYDEFFTLLIMTDVLLLLISFLHTDEFNTVIRNSGFIISTILIKLSFSTDGILNTILTVAAVLFGVIILWIHNQYHRLQKSG
jgi:hypothetical protein